MWVFACMSYVGSGRSLTGVDMVVYGELSYPLGLAVVVLHEGFAPTPGYDVGVVSNRCKTESFSE